MNTKKRFILFSGATLVSLAWYLLNLAPGLIFEDSGELITAAWKLGIAHPPGYAAWCLFSNLFSTLGMGSAAFRMNVSSAVFTALACGMVVWLFAPRIGIAAVAPALALASGRTIWSQAVITEVYGFNLLLCFILLAAWDHFRNRPWSRASVAVISVLAGIGTAAHNVFLLFAAPVAVFMFIDIVKAKRADLLLTGAASLVLGMSCLLYLPLRASSGVFLNWGHPDSLARFWSHVSRFQYGQYRFSRSATELFGQLRIFSHDTLVNAGIAGIVFSIAGLIQGRKKTLTRLLMTVFGLNAAVILAAVNFPIVKNEIEIARILFGPSIAALVLLAADGMQWTKNGWIRTTAALLFLLTAVYNAATGTGNPLLARGGFQLAGDFARSVLGSVPEGSIIVASQGDAVFSLLYEKGVQGRARGVTLWDHYSILQKSPYGDLTRKDPNERYRAWQKAEEHAASYRKLFYTFATRDNAWTARRLEPFGFLYCYGKASSKDVFESYMLRIPDPMDYFSTFITGTVLARKADWLIARGKEKEGINELKLAESLGKENFAAVYMIAGTYEKNMLFAQADRLYRLTMKLNPKHPAPYLALGNLYERHGRIDMAEKAYRLGAINVPADPRTGSALGGFWVRRGKPEKAFEAFAAALTVNPWDLDSLLGMSEVYRMENRTDSAEGILRKVLQMDIDPQLRSRIMNSLNNRR